MMRSALPKRRTRPKMGVRVRERIRCSGHLAWTRGNRCLVENAECSGNMEAHHVRENGNAGTGLKPGDDAVVPLCGFHHARLHSWGATTFQREYRVDLDKTAAELWSVSPHGKRYRLEQGEG